MAKTHLQKKGLGCLPVAFIALGVISLPIILIAGFFFFATAGLRRSDEEVLKTYQPTSEIADIAEKNTLTDKGKATLYRADPTFIDVETFVKYCQTISRGIEALACNAPRPGGGPFGGRQIFLLQIDDPEFSDHKYAAAVHEMLHSVYNNLSSDEKKRVNALVEQELAKHQDDAHLMAIIDALKTKKSNQKGAVDEELHSKFGVEYEELSPELEDYYRQYFNDRQQVVSLFKTGGFNSRVRRIDELNAELGSINTSLTNMQNQLIAYENGGNIDAYNSLVPQFNGLVNQYNAKVAESQRAYNEVQQFYQYFNPDYQPPQSKSQ